MQSLSRLQKLILIVLAIADVIVIAAMGGVIFTSIRAMNQPVVIPTDTPIPTPIEGPTWTPTPTTTPISTIPPRPTNTPTPTSTPMPTRTPTPTPTPGPIEIINPDFDLLMVNRIPGWQWDAYINYKQDGDYNPDTSYAEPMLAAADDPSRQINGTTLKIETIRWLKFRVWVHQTVTVTTGSTVRFEIKASAFSSLDRVKVQAGIDPTGAENCYEAKWSDPLSINQDDGVVTLKSPRIIVGEEGRITICMFAEPTFAHVNNAAFFDQAVLIAAPPQP